MGIKVEFNPDLALRDFSHYKRQSSFAKGSEGQGREKEECIPPDMKGHCFQTPIF